MVYHYGRAGTKMLKPDLPAAMVTGEPERGEPVDAGAPFAAHRCGVTLPLADFCRFTAPQIFPRSAAKCAILL
jgi:hypothetical protein